ncbi:MAG: hypothetical protein AAFS10_00820 [Myxococcota bacterium]
MTTTTMGLNGVWKALAMVIVLAIGSTACNLNEFEEEFDTEFTIPAPNGGLGAEPYRQSKRFKMERDPRDAEDVRFLGAALEVIAPDGADLTFMTQLDVYVCASNEFEDCTDPDSENLTLLASATGFEPGETKRSLDIQFNQDIRGFVTDKRVLLSWFVYPTGWGYTWPEEGVTLRTDVRLLIRVDVL